ncbi:MAG: hypothetical protein SGI77_13080 [Pirellulaceae bacterium]|nr:hypothetical protein [Pirellulaceae bacterium]
MESNMGRGIREFTLLAFLGSSLGCAFCASPFDQDYVTYGSRTPRQNMKCGRVGSPFSDPALNGVDVTSVGVEALDESYEEILEGNDDGPLFMDEPGTEFQPLEGSF